MRINHTKDHSAACRRARTRQRAHRVGIETYCAITLRVLNMTNPSKIRTEAMTVEIGSLIPREDKQALMQLPMGWPMGVEPTTAGITTRNSAN